MLLAYPASNLLLGLIKHPFLVRILSKKGGSLILTAEYSILLSNLTRSVPKQQSRLGQASRAHAHVSIFAILEKLYIVRKACFGVA